MTLGRRSERAGSPRSGGLTRVSVSHLPSHGCAVSWCLEPDDRRRAEHRKGRQWPCSWTPTPSRAESRSSDVASAHQADLATQDAYGVNYVRYWVDEAAGKIFCLVEAPDAEAAATVHREAHGLVADEIYAVAEGA